MTITLELPEATFTALREEAGAKGRPAEQIAAEHLAAFYANSAGTVTETLFDYLQGYVGTVSGTTEPLSAKEGILFL